MLDLQILDSFYRRIHGARRDQAHQPGDLDRVVCRLVGLIRKAEGRERSGRRHRFPLGLDRRELYLLHFARGVTGLVAQDDDGNRRREPEAGRDRKRTYGEGQVA